MAIQNMRPIIDILNYNRERDNEGEGQRVREGRKCFPTKGKFCELIFHVFFLENNTYSLKRAVKVTGKIHL